MKNYKSSGSFRTIQPAFLVFLIIASLNGCNKKNYANKPAYQFASNSAIPNYANLDYWGAHPAKHDPSDSVPKPILSQFRPDPGIDVFFIHPTTLIDPKDSSWNARIDDAEINARTDYSSILYQASVFNEYRVYAPRYRQAHYRSFFTDNGQAYFDLAYADIKNAFQYYLQHEHNGHPIIIAAHSQGTLHAGKLLKEFFEGKPLAEKLVCAYLVGMPIPENYFTLIPPCRGPDSTGCFAGWRSFRTGYKGPDYIRKEIFKSIVVNPISWTVAPGKVPAALNKGAVLLKFDKIIDHAVSAEIHGNILWVSKPDVFGKFLIRKKNFHIGDINLFYMDIRENCRTRVAAFRKKYN